eukprot:29560-Pelagococcus_subviridis.AAC.3
MQADAGKNPQGSAFTARTRPRGNQRKENAPDAVDQSPRQPRRVLAIVLHLLQRDRARLSEPDDERRRERAGAQPALLAAAADERLHSHARPPPHVDGADALRAVHLVPADREQVDLHVLDVDRDLPHRLRGVRVKEHLALAAQLADRLQRLHDADLVVHRHHRDDRGVVADRAAQLLEVDQTVRLHGQVRHVPPALLQPPARVQHALVVRLRRDDVLLLPRVEIRDALD